MFAAKCCVCMRCGRHIASRRWWQKSVGSHQAAMWQRSGADGAQLTIHGSARAAAFVASVTWLGAVAESSSFERATSKLGRDQLSYLCSYRRRAHIVVTPSPPPRRRGHPASS